jgi:predicted O-methyltransferase YrrM
MLTEKQLTAACLALIGGRGRLSSMEGKLRGEIRRGGDPLGDAFSSLRSAAVRRAAGAIYTPAPIVHSMMSWLAAQGQPARIVDPGAGSGRFIMAAGQAFPDAHLVAVETDPLAALTLRANLSCRVGWSARRSL